MSDFNNMPRVSTDSNELGKTFKTQTGEQKEALKEVKEQTDSSNYDDDFEEDGDEGDDSSKPLDAPMEASEIELDKNF
jgi:hypothetical protein